MQAVPLQWMLQIILLTFIAPATSEDYQARWMWGDPLLGDALEGLTKYRLARLNPMRWSNWLSIPDIIAELQKEERAAHDFQNDNRKRPVDITIKSLDGDDKPWVDKQMPNLFQAITKLRKWKHEEDASKEKKRIIEEIRLIEAHEMKIYEVQWMWGDAGVIHALAEMDPLNVRWSKWQSVDETIMDLKEVDGKNLKRPVDILIREDAGERTYEDSPPQKLPKESVADAIKELEGRKKEESRPSKKEKEL